MANDNHRRSDAPAPQEVELDPVVAQLFVAAAEQTANPGEPFVEELMHRLRRRQRRSALVRAVLGVALLMLAVPLQDPLDLVTDYLISPLINAENELDGTTDCRNCRKPPVSTSS